MELRRKDFTIHKHDEGLAYMYLDNYNPLEMIDQILKNQEIVKRVNQRIEWVRKQLEHDLTKERSSDFQWLLQHVITLETGEFEGKFWEKYNEVNKYELELLVEAIASSLTKVKRPRGACDKLTMKPPIIKVPKGFRVDLEKIWKGV